MNFSGKQHRAVFLDRDGTINRDFGYVYRTDRLQLLPNAARGIREMNRKGYLVIVISNQSGIARGYYTLDQALRFNEALTEALRQEGARVDDIFMCPHGEDDGCDCRKPRVGLFLRAADQYDIDLTKSYCLGDRVRDIEGMARYGCKCALIGREVPGYLSYPDLYAAATEWME